MKEYKVIRNGKVSYHNREETKKLIDEWCKKNNLPFCFLMNETWMLNDTIYLNDLNKIQ